MKPLVWIMKKQKNNTRLNGFYLLILILFFLSYAGMDRNTGNLDVASYSEPFFVEVGNEYHFEKSEISAYHKITLGIPVNLNKESVEGLRAIPGIGKTIALAIQKERIKRHGFSNINDLKSIPGIGDKTLLKILPYIRL